MYVHESGVGYWLYIQNDKYANQVLEDREAEISGTVVDKPYDSSLHDYIEKIVASIPELKEYEANGGGLGVVILPKSASSTLKDAVSQTSTKMLDEGEDENILKGVLGIIKYNYSYDVEYGTGTSGVSTIKNDTYHYDIESLNNVLSKFQDIYASNGALSAGLGKFSQYLGEIYDELQKDANPTSDAETTANTSTDNDLVETLMQEMEKSEEDKTPGADQLNKKLYKNYIKSLKSSLVGGLLQQTS